MLYYITYTNIPTKKAFGYAIAKMCSSFADRVPVTLVIPKKRKNDISEDIYSYYNLRNNFSIKEIPIIDASRISFFGSKIAFLIEKTSFAFSLLFLKVFKSDICYSRDILSLSFLRMKTKNVFLEIHYLSRSDAFLVHCARFAKKIIVITSFLKNELTLLGYKAENIHIAPDAVDLDLFQNIPKNKEDLRKEFNFPTNKKIVVYTGNLFPWKGVYTLVNSFEFVSEDALLIIVGGSDDTLPEFKKYCASKVYRDRILILGHKKHEEIPLYLKVADFLVLPNSAKEHISKYNTSPLKLFEYMASGNPIIASDLPSLREVLNEENAFFVIPDDAASLGKDIDYVNSHNEEARAKAQKALSDVKTFTWEIRSRNILEFIGIKK